VWGSLTVAENLAFVGQSFAMPAARVRSRGDELLERAGRAARDRLGRDLSGGMRQKLGFVLAILHDPRLVLLDEPSTGVDPSAVSSCGASSPRRRRRTPPCSSRRPTSTRRLAR
jgi:ABC-2 type transport system ATP-binding protein